MNGLVKIGRQTDDHGSFADEVLDFEQTWESSTEFIMKCYDANSRTVYISVEKETLLETMFGDIRQIKERNTLPPPQEGK